MALSLDRLDWSLLQVFLATAETGSFSAAGRQLAMSQPTVGRHVKTLEDSLEAQLFTRTPNGMALTERGRALFEHAQAMQRAAEAARLAGLGQAGREAGAVRVTASIFVSHNILPRLLAELRQAHPAFTIDLVASDKSENLLFREADIAIRMYRPRQLDMVTRHIGDVQVGLFGSRDYIRRRGMPERESLLDHDFVGYDRDDEIIRGFRAHGMDVDRDFFVVRTDNQAAYWEMVRAGCGLGFGQVAQADADPDLVRIPVALDIPPLQVWLTAHERVRQIPRVARVWEFLSERLADHCDGPPARA